MKRNRQPTHCNGCQLRTKASRNPSVGGDMLEVRQCLNMFIENYIHTFYCVQFLFNSILPYYINSTLFDSILLFSIIFHSISSISIPCSFHSIIFHFIISHFIIFYLGQQFLWVNKFCGSTLFGCQQFLEVNNFWRSTNFKG